MDRNDHRKDRGRRDFRRDKNRRDERTSGSGGGSNANANAASAPPKKSWGADVTQQFVDTGMGPAVEYLVRQIPQKAFDDPATRKLLDLSSWLTKYLSIGIARVTNTPPLIDDLRTRFVAAWEKSVKDRLEGRVGAPQEHPAAVKGAIADLKQTLDGMANFSMFALNVGEDVWAAWLAGLEELDEAKRKRVSAIFAAMKPQQVEKIAQRMQRGTVPDFSTLFGIFDVMGFLPGDEKHGAPEERETKAIMAILALDEVTRLTIVDFLDYVQEKFGNDAVKKVRQLMASWNNQEFERLASMPTHDHRCSLLLSEHRRQGDSEFWDRIEDWLQKRRDAHEEARKRNDTLHKENRTRIDALWAQIHGTLVVPADPAGGEV
ncbi:MAG: hypothetical protein PHY34_04460 [Patescibacteria group bacterium]|nr:hypothetical protein [Patescibacteria group bacterium]MDD5715691.1 hypothetical protein [Patescibacteria group bacterium]